MTEQTTEQTKEQLKKKTYLARKKKEGWIAIYMIVPPEIAPQIKAYRLKLKLENTHLYKKI